MFNLNLDNFISKHITKRDQSLFIKDIILNSHRLHKSICDKKIMVIGGAGTIGSAFIKELLKFEPKSIVVVDYNENQLTKLMYDLRGTHKIKVPTSFKVYPVNYGDNLFFNILQYEGPFDAIANFAGQNHIHDESDYFAVRALLESNIINMQFLFDRLLDSKIEHFFAVAAGNGDEPETFMGVSNKISEEIILAYSHIIPLTSAKFHNVAFSGGSMLCGYLDRIIKRQPITAPVNISRSFISPEEAGQLSLLACYAGSSGDTFFPKNLENSVVPYSQIANSFLVELGLTPVEYPTLEEAKEAASKLDDNSPKMT